MDYILFKGWKTLFYRLVVFFKPRNKSLFSASYYLDSIIIDRFIFSGNQVSALILLIVIFFIPIFIYTAYAGKDFFGINVLESQTLLNYINIHLTSLKYLTALFCYFAVSLIMIICFFLIFFSYIEAMPIFILLCLFPVKNGFVDLSDVPIHFINLAIQELQTLIFLENFDQLQSKKNQISNLINDSLEFVKIDKEKRYPDYMNFCYLKYSGLLNIHATNDIMFRANGLYEKMNKTLIKINHMNCIDDKDEIEKDLEIYLKVIENRDLSKIEAVQFEIKDPTIDRTISFLFYKVLIPILLILFGRLLP
jgi:hypothetical protein